MADYKDLPAAPGRWLKFYNRELLGWVDVVFSQDGASTIERGETVPIRQSEHVRFYGPIPRDEQVKGPKE